MDKIDLTKHAEAILTAQGLMNAAELARKPAILTACAALFDAGARAMQETGEAQADWYSEDGRELGISLKTLRAIDPATLRD